MDKETIIVTPVMIDDMKTTITTFLGVQVLGNIIAVAWLFIPFDHMLLRIFAAFTMAAYAMFALFICAHAWHNFKTKIAVLN